MFDSAVDMLKAPVKYLAKEATEIVTDVLDIGNVVSDFLPDPAIEAAMLGVDILDYTLGTIA